MRTWSIQASAQAHSHALKDSRKHAMLADGVSTPLGTYLQAGQAVQCPVQPLLPHLQQALLDGGILHRFRLA